MYSSPSPREIEKLIEGHPWWYHSMELGHGLATPGHHYLNLVPVSSLLRHLSLKGRRCLDIGAMDGKMSFAMEAMGGDVLAVDLFERKTVADICALFDSSVQYEFGVHDRQIGDLGSKHGHFDFILCVGVLYHIISPMDLILHVRHLCKSDGLVIFETASLDDTEKAYMQMNWGDLYEDITTVWLATIACFRRMVQFACFEIVAETTLVYPSGLPPRHAILARATKPAELAENAADEWSKNIYLQNGYGLGHKYLKPQLDIERFETAPYSTILIPDNLVRYRRIQCEDGTSYAAESDFLAWASPASLARTDNHYSNGNGSGNGEKNVDTPNHVRRRTSLDDPVLSGEGYSPPRYHKIRFADNDYNMVLMMGDRVTVKASAQTITRVAFIDEFDGICFVEFGGAGELSLFIPEPIVAPPRHYIQPGLEYATGRASIVLTGANETTFLSIYSLGTDPLRIDPSLVKDAPDRRGAAYIQSLSISGREMGGLNLANTWFHGSDGIVGINAGALEKINFSVLYLGDVNAGGSAQAVLDFAPAANLNIILTGGNLAQPGNRPVIVSGVKGIKLSSGQSSLMTPVPASASLQSRLIDWNGNDITDRLTITSP